MAVLVLLALLAVDGAVAFTFLTGTDEVLGAGGEAQQAPDGADERLVLRDDGTPRMTPIAPAAVVDRAPVVRTEPDPYVLPAAVAWKDLGSQDSHDDIQFTCPQSDGTDFIGGSPAAQTIVVRASCPFRIIDDQDLLGSPQLAVDRNDPNKMAFFSLHGAATDQGPTPRSRSTASDGVGARQSHTTFTSITQGTQWEDNPHGREGYGEMADGLMDRSGRIYSTYLFSSPVGVDGGTKVFDYHFQLYHDNDVTDGMSHFGTKVRNRAAGNVIEEVNLVLVTPRTQIESQQEFDALRNQTQEEEDPYNGTAAPASDDDVGARADGRPANYTDDPGHDVVMAVWHERAYDHQNASTGKSSWIDAVWTRVGTETEWEHLDDSQLIGPCRDASDPAPFNGRVLVACVVDAGYQGRAGAKIGEVDLWAIDPATGETELLSTVPGLVGGRPRLATNTDGRVALASVKLLGDGPTYDNVQVFLNWGWYGRQWDGSPQTIGGNLHGVWYDDVRDARISAMALMDGTNALYLGYTERGNNSLGSPTFDPNGETPVSPTDFIEYGKVLAKFQPCTTQALMLYDLQVGQVRHPFQEGIVNDNTGAFDDLQDGMSTWIHPDTAEPFVYFVYGDHGVIQYGAFSGQSGADVCPVPAPPILFSAPPPIPVSLAPPAGAPIGLGLTAGVASAAGLGMLLRQKRKQVVALATKAK